MVIAEHASGSGERFLRKRRVIHQRHELAGIGDLAGEVVALGRANSDDAHLALDLGADLRAEAAGIAEDARRSRQHVAGAVRQQFGHGDHGDVRRAQAARDDGLELHHQRAGGDEDLAAGMRPGGMAAFAQSKVFTDGASFTNKGGAAGTIGLAEFVRTAKGDDNALLVTGVIMLI